MNGNMQFRDFIFPNNPQSIEVSDGGRVVNLFCPGRGEVVQNLGDGARVAKCRGSFYGGSFAEASAILQSFRRAAGQEGTGSLFLPGCQPFRAHLRSLMFELQGDGRILPYTMVFVEVRE